jgi:hypothetical protein
MPDRKLSQAQKAALEGILRPSKVREHRDTGKFEPTFDLPPSRQSWIETDYDVLLEMVDPTGEEKITEVGAPPPIYTHRPVRLLDTVFPNALIASQVLGIKPSTIQRYAKHGRLPQLDAILKRLDKKVESKVASDKIKEGT